MLLNLLNKEFKARVRVRELPHHGIKADTSVAKTLFDKGILSFSGQEVPDTAPCPLGLHDGDGLVFVEKQSDGSYQGLCQEHGELVTIKAQDAEWVSFDHSKWVAAVRSKNGLVDDSRLLQSGVYYLGRYQNESSRIGVIVRSSFASDSIINLPNNDKPYLIIKLEKHPDQKPVPQNGNQVYANDLFRDDFITIKKNVISNFMKGTAQKSHQSLSDGIRRYSNDQSKPEIITDDQYLTVTKSGNIKKFNLFMDQTKGIVWRDGIKVSYMANAKSRKKKQTSLKKTKKKISPSGLKLIAEYIKTPKKSMSPKDTETYAPKDGLDPGSAQVMLLNMRRSLKLERVLITGPNKTGNPGDCVYHFSPPQKFKYCLITN